jgi:uncharacterized protein YciI
MPFFIETFDKPDHGHVRQRARESHLEYLAANKARLLACGAKLSDDGNSASGGVYLLDVETREEAERFIANDPLLLAELFERVSVTRWRKAYLDGECFL